MKLETTTVIGGVEVEDSGEKLMGHRIFLPTDEYYGLTMYIVDSNGNLKSKINVSVDCGQNVGFISDWSVQGY